MFKAMARLFGRPTTRTQIHVIQRDPCRLTLKEWRSVPELVLRARKYLADPNFRIMLDVLTTEDPSNLSYMRISLEERAVIQARCEGYRMAISTLEAMGRPLEVEEALESTFEPEEQPESKEQ